MLYSLTVLLSLLLTLYLVFRSHTVQTLLARIGADFLSQKLQTEIRIRGVDLSFRHGLIMEDLHALDLHRDTLLSVQQLGIKPGKFSIREHRVNVRQVMLRQGTVQLLTHQGDSVLNLAQILEKLASADTTTPPPDTTAGKPWDLTVSSVLLEQMHFRFQDENEPPEPAGMDYSNLDVKNIHLELNDIAFDEYSVYAKIRNLSAKERCGLVIQNLSGSFQVGSRFLKAHDLKIRTDHSNLSLNFDFLYNNWSAYNEFLDSVIIKAKIDTSFLDMRDIGFFAPDLATMHDRIGIAGIVRGSVSNFKARNLFLQFGRHTFFSGNINALGLPDLEETFADLDIRRLTTSKSDLEAFFLPGSIGRMDMPEILENAGVVSVKGKFTGFYNDFVANASVSSGLGSVAADLSLIRDPKTSTMSYIGRLSAQSLDLGILTGEPGLLGKVTLNADLNGKGITLDDADLTMNLRVDSIWFNNYLYRQIGLSGLLCEKRFSGDFRIDDPHLGLDFHGEIDLADSVPAYDFEASLRNADLHRLHLLSRDSVTDLSTRIYARIKGNNLDNLDGYLRIDSTRYVEGQKIITMDRFLLLTRQDTARRKSYHIQSDYIDADIFGSFAFSSMIPSLTTFVRNYLANFNPDDSVTVIQPGGMSQNLVFSALFKQSDEITSVFLPFLRIAPGAKISGSYDEAMNKLVINGEARSVFISGVEIDNWYLNAETRNNNLSVVTGAGKIYLIKATAEDSLEMRVDSLLLLSDIRNDSIIYNLQWSGAGKSSVIGGSVSFSGSPSIVFRFSDFDVFLAEKYWNIDKRNRVIMDTGFVDISGLTFMSGDQYLSIDGRISDVPSDTLRVGFNKVDISRADMLLGDIGIDLDGILQGNARLTNIYRNLTVLADLRINKFRFNKELLGDASFNIGYDNDASRFNILARIIYSGNVGQNIPFNLQGNLVLDKENPSMDFDLNLKNLNLKMFGPFVRDFMSGISGLASGNARIRGSLLKPVITGQLQMMRTEFRISYLNVPFSFADVITIDTNAFIFDHITMFDSLGHKATLNGRITHRNFNDLRLDLHADMTDFAVFNNTRAQNSLFYGNARATGQASITGPVENIAIDVKATNGEKTHVTIPIDLTQSVDQADYIIFVDPAGDTLPVSARTPMVNNSGISIDLALRINDAAEVEVFFPEQLGNLKASGTGNLSMTMSPTTPFSLSGTYTLTKGYFLFQLKNYLRLPMALNGGSTIRWVGDPTDAAVSISATYKTKVPLKGITTEPSLENIRIPVECIIRLNGKLMNPDISFSLNLPNVEEAIKSQVFSAIDTTNPVTLADQAIYLLVLNQFKPVTGTTSVDMSGTAVSLVTNQLNSLISGISSKVSVNMNYVPGTSSTSQEFDVGISTQLFDDRLLIDGTFGMNSVGQTTQQTSTIVGDINIEYILTKNRRWRVRAFNRTNTTSILYNNAPYTQGIGIKYQRDFTSFGELFGLKKVQ